jgi:ribonuclease HI
MGSFAFAAANPKYHDAPRETTCPELDRGARKNSKPSECSIQTCRRPCLHRLSNEPARPSMEEQGWGAVIIDGKKRRELSGANPWTTISEMELVAALEALRTLSGRHRVLLHSDSRYLIDGMTHLAQRWQRYGWKNSRGAFIQYRPVCCELIFLNELHHVRWRWQQGHRGHPIQNRADALAYGAARTCLNPFQQAA